MAQCNGGLVNPVCKNTVGHKNRKMYDSEECPLEKIHFRLIESSESKRKCLISFEFPLKKFLIYDFLSCGFKGSAGIDNKSVSC